MDLFYPSTWTRRKTLTTFCLVFLNSQKTEAGLGSKNCLNTNSHTSHTTYYDSLLNFSFANNNEINNSQLLSLCCNNSTSSCFIATPLNCLEKLFICNKVAQSIFCVGGGCGTIVGDKMITNNITSGSCQTDFETIENYLAISSHTLEVDRKKRYAS
jgi:hypothetical protein